MILSRFVRPCVLCVLCVLVSCGREQWKEADEKLNSAAAAARGLGFEPMSGPHNAFGSFTAPGSEPWRVHLEAHQPYYIGAACTAGCDSLGFVIKEPHGAQVAADTTAGPTPRLEFTTTEEGDYSIEIQYGACSQPKCRWIAQIYTRRRSD